MQRSVRVIVVAVMAATAALFAVAGPAGAKGKPAKVVINCGDPVTSINVTVQMRTGGAFGQDIGQPISASCVTSGVGSGAPAKDVPKADSFNYSYTFPSSVTAGCTGGGGGAGFAQRGDSIELVCGGEVQGVLSVS